MRFIMNSPPSAQQVTDRFLSAPNNEFNQKQFLDFGLPPLMSEFLAEANKLKGIKGELGPDDRYAVAASVVQTFALPEMVDPECVGVLGEMAGNFLNEAAGIYAETFGEEMTLEQAKSLEASSAAGRILGALGNKIHEGLENRTINADADNADSENEDPVICVIS